MMAVHSLTVLTLRPLVAGACRVVGVAAGDGAVDGVVGFLAERFADQSARLTEALHQAHARAWRTLEVALAGPSWWQTLSSRGEDHALAAQVRTFLDSLPAGAAPDRAAALAELQAARKAHRLTPGPVEPRRLTELAGPLARFADPAAVLAAEREALGQFADWFRELRYPHLADLLALEPRPEQSLVVVAARYFFRRAVERDDDLARGLAFAQMESLAATQEAGFAALDAALTAHAARLEQLLADVHGAVVETRDAVFDLQREIQGQSSQVRDLGAAVLKLLDQHQLQRRELRPADSLSIRGDGEREAVKALVARYRALPGAERQRLPALLNEVGKLQVVAGDYEGAQSAFREVVQLADSPAARAEAHHNAYRAALERHDWAGALAELTAAVQLDAGRFQPFPMDKYEPQRILGAGGFGVAFLCKHRISGIPLVVKTLTADDLDRDIGAVFAEARALEALEHPAIIRLRDCDYADAAARSRPYLVMDYFEGLTLEEHVQQHGPLAVEELAGLARVVADGLQAAHAKGILHRDVKPANVLVRKEAGERGASAPRWRAKVIDFGLALRRQGLESTLKAAATGQRTLVGSSIAGTLDYAAPEQMGRLPGQAVGAAADIYSFGKTCCYALFKTPQPSYHHWRKLPEPVANLLGHCTAESPAERPASFAVVLEGLGAATSAPEELPPPRPRHRAPEPVPEERPAGRRSVIGQVFYALGVAFRVVFLGDRPLRDTWMGTVIAVAAVVAQVLLAGGACAGLGILISRLANRLEYVGHAWTWDSTINQEHWIPPLAVWAGIGALAGVRRWWRRGQDDPRPATVATVQFLWYVILGAALGGGLTWLAIWLAGTSGTGGPFLVAALLPAILGLLGGHLIFDGAAVPTVQLALGLAALALVEAGIMLGLQMRTDTCHVVAGITGGVFGVLFWAKRIEWVARRGASAS